MNRFCILFVLAIAGCGSEEGRDNHGYGWHYDSIGETGLRVRHISGQTTPSLAEIEKLYRDTMVCTEIHAAAPLVIFVMSIGPYNRGITYLDTGTVIIATEINSNQSEMTWTHKHEFVHHLLHQSGLSVKDNSAHQSNLFLNCTVP